MVAELRICPDAAHAPRGCGLVRVQVVRDENGEPLYTWTCTFCAEQQRPRWRAAQPAIEEKAP